LIGFTLLNSRFISSLAITADAVYSCKEDMDPIFRLLVRDDLVAFYTKSIAKSDSKTVEMEKQLAGSTTRNVATLHARFAECAPTFNNKIEKEDEKAPVDKRVRELMTRARNPENLALASGSFQGWL